MLAQEGIPCLGQQSLFRIGHWSLLSRVLKDLTSKEEKERYIFSYQDRKTGLRIYKRIRLTSDSHGPNFFRKERSTFNRTIDLSATFSTRDCIFISSFSSWTSQAAKGEENKNTYEIAETWVSLHRFLFFRFLLRSDSIRIFLLRIRNPAEKKRFCVITGRQTGDREGVVDRWSWHKKCKEGITISFPTFG